MYRCLECKAVFDEPYIEYEDCTPGGAFEGGSFMQEYRYCPVCHGEYDEYFEDEELEEEDLDEE